MRKKRQKALFSELVGRAGFAEGARLESVYTRKCIEGSNPSLTAKFKEKAWIRVQAFFLHGALRISPPQQP